MNNIACFFQFLPSEYFFSGHFPNKPIVPGVILIEALAQTAGVVVAREFEKRQEKSVLFMSISKAKFRKPVLPNDEIVFEVKMMNDKNEEFNNTLESLQ